MQTSGHEISNCVMYNGGKETELSEETCFGLGVRDNLPERKQ